MRDMAVTCPMDQLAVQRIEAYARLAMNASLQTDS